MLKKNYLYIVLSIMFCTTLVAQQQTKEEYFVKRLKDKSFCILKKQTVTFSSGLILTKTIPVEKLPEGYSLEEENVKDFFIRIAKKNGPYLLLTLFGIAVATEQPRKVIAEKCIEKFKIQKDTSKERINSIINLAPGAINSLFFGAAWQTLLDVYKGKQPKVVKDEASSQTSTFFLMKKNN